MSNKKNSKIIDEKFWEYFQDLTDPHALPAAVLYCGDNLLGILHSMHETLKTIAERLPEPKVVKGNAKETDAGR